MIEIKLSQGAKPGHGGVLPKSKVSPEIAEARGVPLGQDCVSPARHSAFSTPKSQIQKLPLPFATDWLAAHHESWTPARRAETHFMASAGRRALTYASEGW